MILEKFFGCLSGLSGTHRFSNAKLISPESVLEHVGGVVLTCYLLCLEMNERHDSVDVGDVLAKAAVHDIEELLMGDIPRTVKYSTPRSRESFKVVEEWAMKKIVTDLDIVASEELLVDHDTAKLGPSGVVVEIADILAVVYKIHEEVIERGNRTMITRATSCRDQVLKSTKRVLSQTWHRDVKEFLIDVLNQAIEIIDLAEGQTSTAMIGEKRMMVQ